MKAFLLMPYDDPSFDPSLDWLYEEIVAAGAGVGVEVDRGEDIFEYGELIIEPMKSRMATADAVIAVCTGQNPHVFYELGLADRYHRPILVAEYWDDLPFDVHHYQAVLYGDDRETLRERVAVALVETIRAARLNLDRPKRPSGVALTVNLVRNIVGHEQIEIRNPTNVPLYKVTLEVPEEANWSPFLAMHREYPIPVIPPGLYRRTPVLIAMGCSQLATTVTVRGFWPSGKEYSTEQFVSVYD